MKKLILLLTVLLPILINAQIIDDFSDGDFTANPVWSGDNTEFEIVMNQLNSSGPDATSVLYISTANNILNNITWEFLVDMRFKPSNSNRLRVYLVSDQANLEGSLNGYFIQIGESGNDEIRFFRQDADDTETPLFIGSSSLNQNVFIRFQITRDASGNWQINADITGGTTYSSEGGSILDNTHTSTSYFGFVCFHTKMRKNLFFFDDISIIAASSPIAVNSVSVKNNTSLLVTFNQNVDQNSAELTTNYALNNSITVMSAIRDAVNFDEVILTVSTLTTNSYVLTVSNIQDDATNTPLVTPSIQNFSYTQLALQSLVINSATEIQLTFNDNLESTTAEDENIYHISNGIGMPGTATLDAEDNSIVILTLLNPLQTSTNYTLTYGTINNSVLNSNITTGTTQEFIFVLPLLINTVTIFSATEIKIEFNQNVDQISAQKPMNYFIDNAIGNPIMAVQNAIELDKIILTLSIPLTENTFTITINRVSDTNGNVIAPGSTAMFTYFPLNINSIRAVNDMEIEITFNQDVDQTTAETIINYSADGELGISNRAILNREDNTKVNITFSTIFVNNTYNLTINNVTNVISNSTASNLLSIFSFETATSFRTIVINEIFADPNGNNQPSPVILPNGTSDEFIELYNSSNRSININNFTLSGGRLADFTLAPNAYVILTNNSNITNFTTFGDVVGVTSWNTLSNGGESLVLKDNLNNLVDSLTYNTDWYKDVVKNDGGWTIEQINPNLICGGYIRNWTASNDIQGGTPGTQNSVFDNTPDTTRPNIVKIEAVDDNTIRLTFDESMDETSLNRGTYTIDNGLTQTTVSTNLGLFSVDIDLDASLISGTTYMVTIMNVADCSGNAIAANNISLIYDATPPVLERIMVISLNKIELYFNENLNKVIAETESNFTVNNTIGNPSSAILDNENNNLLILTFSSDFILNLENILSLKNIEDLNRNAVTGMINQPFTLEQNIDTVLVLGINQLDILFKIDLQQTTAQTTTNYIVSGGVGNPALAILDVDNNALVHLVFGTDLDDNKNLTLTVRNQRNTMDEFIITLDYVFVYDTNAPKLNLLTVQNATQILLDFNETLEQTSVESINNYTYNNLFPTTAILQSNNQSVLLTFSTDFKRETKFILNISGIKDVFRNTLRNTINEDFIYDIFPPELDSLIVVSPTSLLLIYNENVEETSSETINNYNLDNGIGNSILATQNNEFNNQVLLEFGSTIPFVDELILSVNLVSDIRANTINSVIQISVDYSTLSIGRIRPLSTSIIEVTFNKPPNAILATDASNYTINGASISQAQVGIENNIYLLSLNEALSDNTTDTLSILNITSLTGALLQQNEFIFDFKSQFNKIELISSNTIEIDFNVYLDAVSATSTSNYNLSPTLGNPLTVILINDRVRLIFDYNFDDNINYTITWMGISNVFNNRLPDFSFEFNVDNTSPVVSTVEAILNNLLSLKFNESLYEPSAEKEDLYFVDNGIGNPSKATYNLSDSTVLLEFKNQFSENITYQINIDRVEDLVGNKVNNQRVNFTYTPPLIPQFGELIITEIMADPTPSNGLPEEEYVEIYNNSTNIFNLSTVIFSDNSNSFNLGNIDLLPNEYIIITSDGSGFNQAISIIIISNFPSLTNSGETISLSNIDGNILDKITYQTSFYRDDTKDDGGYSLERIFFAEQCSPELNWVASTDASGGTPGSQNSVFNTFSDTQSPEVLSLTIVGDQSIRLVFNEPMDSLSLVEGNYMLTNNLLIDRFEEVKAGSKEMLIVFTTVLNGGVIYNINISDISDCMGNRITATNFNFGLAKQPSFNELIITEIMADPDPNTSSNVSLPSVEYLELYNPTDKTIDLSGLILKDKTSQTTLSTYLLFSNQYVLLIPNSGKSLYTNIPVLPVSSWTSLNNGSETLAIFNENELIFSVAYNDNWYKDSNKKGGGYSLEMIDITNPCGDINNWTASIDSRGGTPTMINSVATGNPDNFGPQLIDAIANSPTKITLVFDEKLNPNTIMNGTFTISPTININSLNSDSVEITSITAILSTELTTKQTYTITANAFVDCVGNLVRSKQNTATLVLPEPSISLDIILNEILFNPRSGGVDFVEVYNNSDKAINFNGWKLARFDNNGQLDAKTITSRDLIILPATYKVFTTNPVNIKENYPATDETTLLEVTSLPSMPNDAGTIIILDSLGNQIDLFDYNEKFHFNLLDDVNGVSLERINFSAETNNANSWKSASSTAGFATPGLMNSQFIAEVQTLGTLTIEPKVFLPDNTGVNNFTTINYNLQHAGNFANIIIYNHRGQLVKTIAQGDLLSTSGFFTWDGIDDSGQKANFGYYIIYFEIFDSSGNTDVMKETIILGTRF